MISIKTFSKLHKFDIVIFAIKNGLMGFAPMITLVFLQANNSSGFLFIPFVILAILWPIFIYYFRIGDNSKLEFSEQEIVITYKKNKIILTKEKILGIEVVSSSSSFFVVIIQTNEQNYEFEVGKFYFQNPSKIKKLITESESWAKYMKQG